jgi:hypothetical protein
MPCILLLLECIGCALGQAVAAGSIASCPVMFYAVCHVVPHTVLDGVCNEPCSLQDQLQVA